MLYHSTQNANQGLTSISGSGARQLIPSKPVITGACHPLIRILSILLISLCAIPVSAQGNDVIEEIEPNDSLQNAQLLEEEVVVVGGVTGTEAEVTCSRPVDRYDTYKIPFNRAGTLELTITRTSSHGRIELLVYSDLNDPEPSVYRPFDSAARVPVKCVDADTLFVRVHDPYNDECVDYWLSWKGIDPPRLADNPGNDDRINEAHRVSFGGVIEGRVGYGSTVGRPDQIDYYMLTDIPEGDITFYLETDSLNSLLLDMSGPFPNPVLRAPMDSVTLECVGRIDSLLISLSAPFGCSSYSLRTVARPSATREIEPDVEPNNTIATAILQGFPSILEGRIGEIRFDIGTRRDSVDLYRMELGEGDTMRGYIRFYDLTSGRLVLRDATGKPLLSWSQNGLQNPSDSIPIEMFAVEPGPVFISVESGDDDCGFYEGYFSISGTSSVRSPDNPDRPTLSTRRGILELTGINPSAGVIVELYDVRGEKVAERAVDDLRSLGLPAGIYLYRILSEGELVAEGQVRIGLP